MTFADLILMFIAVATLVRAESEDHAIELANKSRFGLGGGVFTRDEDKASSPRQI
jgi:succinate-semialdehyde dehydrogenase/glutarate-semialdehyde dehydrogenase